MANERKKGKVRKKSKKEESRLRSGTCFNVFSSSASYLGVAVGAGSFFILVLSSFLTGEESGLAGEPVGEATGDAEGDTIGLETGAGVGVAAGLLGVSGLFSHAAKIAVVTASAVVNISFLIVFLLLRPF